MFGSVFEIAKIVLLVGLVIPMMIGFVLSVLGVAAVEWSRFTDRSVAQASTRAAKPKRPVALRPGGLSVAD